MNKRRQVVITTLFERLFLIYMEGNDFYDILTEPVEQKPAVGNIYVGKVQNIVKNINAAFVEVQKGVLCYLPLSECGENPIKCGDEIIVQVKKAAVKTKQAVVTGFPELAGRYCVVSTANAKKGISKKINDSMERDKKKEILEQFAGEPFGLVLRTASQQASADAVTEECGKLLADMHEIMDNGRYHTCFSLLRGAVPFYLRYLFGCQPGEIDRIVTDNPDVLQTLHLEFQDSEEMLSLLDYYQDDSFPLEKLYGIADKLKKATEKKVWLKSGGNLVIEPTEALTVIDVNSGKAVEGKRNRETTFFRINCEAAAEAARQIRLRNISGIIIVDFIDMKEKEHKNELMTLLRSELQKDKTKTVLVDITRLNLVEITRMKQNPPLREIMRGIELQD